MAAKRPATGASTSTSILQMLASPGCSKQRPQRGSRKATVLELLASPVAKTQPAAQATPAKGKCESSKKAKLAATEAAEAGGAGKPGPQLDAATGKRLQKRVAEKKNKDDERKRAAELLQANAGKFASTIEEHEEPSDAAEEVEDETWDRERRRLLAETAWAGPVPGAPGHAPDALCSPAFDPRTAPAHRHGSRTEFGLLAAFLDTAVSGPAPTLCAIANIIRLVLHHSADREADLNAVLVVLLAGKRKVPHRYLAEAVAAAFSLRAGSKRAVVADDLADVALAGRVTQKVLFQSPHRRVPVAEVAALLEEHAALAEEGREKGQAARVQGCVEAQHLPERLVKLLGSSVAEGREAWHLVRVLQGHMGFSWDLVIRGLAHAVVLCPPVGAAAAAEAAKPTEAGARAEAMLAMEDAVLRAYSQDGARTGRLVGALFAGAAPEALLEACLPVFGVPVAPMRAEAAKDAAAALEKLGGGAVLAEFLMMGERAQVHIKEGGKVIEVFTTQLRRRTERVEEATGILAGHLVGVESCILEAILVRRKERAVGQESKEQAQPEAPAEEKEGDKDKEPEKGGASLSVVLFDILMLNGASLTQRPLRERREALAAAIKQHARLRLVRGWELSGGESGPEGIAAKLDEALSASYLATEEEKASSRAMGLVLKRLDGPLSTYFAGRAFGQAWQALEKPPVTGPEADKLLLEVLSPEERALMPPVEDFHFTVVSGFRTRTVEGITDILRIQKLYNDAGVVPTWYVDNECPEEYRQLGLKVVKAGKLIPARNLALEDAFKADKICVQTSDDIGCWQFFNDEIKYNTDEEANAASKRAEKLNISPVAAARFLAAKMRARGSGKCRLGGVYPLGNAGRAMRANPFTTHNFILGDFFVAEVSECRFDERLSLKEDYDFTASHLERYGEAFRSNRLIITAKHETNAGGACDARDPEGKKERYNIGILKEKWPGAIYDHPTRANQIVLRWKSLKGKSKSQEAEAEADAAADAPMPEAPNEVPVSGDAAADAPVPEAPSDAAAGGDAPADAPMPDVPTDVAARGDAAVAARMPEAPIDAAAGGDGAADAPVPEAPSDAVGSGDAAADARVPEASAGGAASDDAAEDAPMPDAPNNAAANGDAAIQAPVPQAPSDAAASAEATADAPVREAPSDAAATDDAPAAEAPRDAAVSIDAAADAPVPERPSDAAASDDTAADAPMPDALSDAAASSDAAADAAVSEAPNHGVASDDAAADASMPDVPNDAAASGDAPVDAPMPDAPNDAAASGDAVADAPVPQAPSDAAAGCVADAPVPQAPSDAVAGGDAAADTPVREALRLCAVSREAAADAPVPEALSHCAAGGVAAADTTVPEAPSDAAASGDAAADAPMPQAV